MVALLQCSCWLLELYDSQSTVEGLHLLRGKMEKTVGSIQSPYFVVGRDTPVSALLFANFKYHTFFKITQLPEGTQMIENGSSFL